MDDTIDYDGIDRQIPSQVWLWSQESVIVQAHLMRWRKSAHLHAEGKSDQESKELSIPNLLIQMIKTLETNTREIIDQLPKLPLANLVEDIPVPYQHHYESILDWQNRLLSTLDTAMHLNRSAQSAIYQNYLPSRSDY